MTDERQMDYGDDVIPVENDGGTVVLMTIADYVKSMKFLPEITVDDLPMEAIAEWLDNRNQEENND